MQLINSQVPLQDARAQLRDAFDLDYTKAVARATAPVRKRLKEHVPAVEWPFLAPLIAAIERLKREKNALILAHPYQAPAIYHGVADIMGDTLTLSQKAGETDAEILVQAGVGFQAETTKLFNPERTVLLPDARAGCSLTSAITPEDVMALRAQYPGAPVVCYLSSATAVKAVSDVCCTAANARAIVEAVPGDTVIMVPDQHLAQNTARLTSKKIIAWAGACEVHESFTAADIADLRAAYPKARIITHSESPRAVVEACDFAGGSEAMIAWVEAERPKRLVMVTECAIADNVAVHARGTRFYRSCNLCPHMKRVTLENILYALHTQSEAVVLDEEIAIHARAAIGRMIEHDNWAAARF